MPIGSDRSISRELVEDEFAIEGTGLFWDQFSEPRDISEIGSTPPSWCVVPRRVPCDD